MAAATASMAFEEDPAQAAAAVKKKVIESATALSLSFPTSSTDPSSLLKHLREETTAYSVVAKSCWQLMQQLLTTASDQVDASTVVSSTWVHDASYADLLSQAFTALLHCIKEHEDRRCRIVACNTLAILARSAYGRLRVSPLLYSLRTADSARLEDEIGNEVAVGLVTAALEDSDDGVSAVALSALGRLTLSSSFIVGTATEDCFLREVQGIAFARPSPYAPSLRSCQDEDPALAQAEVTTRIYENIVSPRLLALVDRVVRYSATTYVASALPVVTAALVHQVTVSPAALHGMDAATFAKRWSEVDATGLVDTVVQAIILPALQQGTDAALTSTAAREGLRLAEACGPSTSMTQVCSLAANVLYEEASQLQQPLEARLATLASCVIALRAMPLEERTSRLVDLVNLVARLPSTTSAPAGITSPGILLEEASQPRYRRPARVGLWTEIVLSLFLDGPSSGGGRAQALNQFLSSPAIQQILTAPDNNNKSIVASCRDELILVVCTVAVEAGRRLRGVDGTEPLPTDPTAPAVSEWMELAWAVLTTFSICVNMGTPCAYLEEDLSLLAAGQEAYVKLLQEALHFVGLNQPETSVALKLTSNACPPNLLWDQLGESAAFLATVDMLYDMAGGVEATSGLMDELVAREMKPGIPSHPMRFFILTLAADHWVLAREMGLRRQFEASGGGSSLTLNMQSGRQIIMALSPKRMLAKIIESHVPPVDADGKPKKDPIKKLALESAKVCVAAIENIALMACDWRRRFGRNEESKHVVSVAMGILQGKGDDTSLDENFQSAIRPVCEAAVSRIQASYSNDSSVSLDQPFQPSELVLQPVRMKIKPLVSSSKPPPLKKEDYVAGYLMYVSRQIIEARIEQAVASQPPADPLFAAARAKTWLRLAAPPVVDSKDGRRFGNFGDSMIAAWGKSVDASSASSDACAVVLAYTLRRYLRYDGEEEFRLHVFTRVHNLTAIEFTEGLRIDLGVVQRAVNPLDLDDSSSKDIMESLSGQVPDLKSGDSPLMSSSVVYKQELKAGDCVTWEVVLNHTSPSSNLALMPSVVYRNVEVESDEVGSKWVGDEGGGDTATASGDSKGDDDGFQVTKGDGGAGSKGGAANTDNIRFPGEPIVVSPIVGLQACPFVFFRNCWGDVDTFRFLWFRMPHQVGPVKIYELDPDDEPKSMDATATKISAMSCLTWAGEAIPGGFASRLWAFASLSGDRVFCVLAETDSGGAKSVALHFRADNKAILVDLLGNKTARETVVSSLMPKYTLS